MALNKNIKVFIIYVIFFSLDLILIYESQKVQIILLLTKKVIIQTKYSIFINTFYKKLSIGLLKYLSINKCIINLEIIKQILYRRIYQLKSIKLETFKIYIKTNIIKSYIRLFKSFSRILILFFKNLYCNLCLYINYQILIIRLLRIDTYYYLLVNCLIN